MISILGFLLILAPLVIVHEFGHFFFARLFNVKAEVFSVGFGPRIFAKQWGETEFRWALFPLGGYVKLLGEDREQTLSPEDRARSLHTQAAWKRFFIFFGGPLLNFVFAIFVFVVILLIGEKQITSRVGRVVKGSPAEQAGFKAKDLVLSVDGAPVLTFEAFAQAIADKPKQAVKLEIDRAGKRESLVVQTGEKEGFSQYGEVKRNGEIEGLYPVGRSLKVGVSDPGSVAARAGLKTGDVIEKAQGVALSDWDEFEEQYRQWSPGAAFELTLVGDKPGSSRSIQLEKPKKSLGTPGADLGLHSAELFIQQVVEKSPAAAAGIQPGDRIVAVGGREMPSFLNLKDAVQNLGETKGVIPVRWEHAGAMKSADIVPTGTGYRDPNLKKSAQFTIGIMPEMVWREPETRIERVLNPFMLLFKATERMVQLTEKNVTSIRKMIGGDVSVGTLGGPILIGKIAGDSLGRGIIAFLTTMAVLSVGLGVLNVLPVPVLDGGHLLLLGIEVVRGKPLSLRQMEIVQQVGLSLILLLMVVVIRNDLARLPVFN